MNTIDTEPTKDILSEICNKWNISSNLKFVNKVENYIYYAKKEKLYIRLAKPKHRSLKEIHSELTWLKYLKDEDVLFAHPVQSINNIFVEEIKNNNHTFFVSVFKDAEGKFVTKPEDFTPEAVQSWGKTLGKLHAVTQSFKETGEFTRDEWNTEENFKYVSRVTKPEDGEVHTEWKRLTKLFETLPKNKDVYGLIHSDLHTGNFHVNESGRVTPFDFDDCHYNWFAYDICIVFFYIEESDFNFSWEKFNEYFWNGYLSENSMDSEWRNLVKEFYKYRCVIVYYWCQRKLLEGSLNESARTWMVEKMKWCQENVIKNLDCILV